MLYSNMRILVPWIKEPRNQLSKQNLLVIDAGKIGAVWRNSWNHSCRSSHLISYKTKHLNLSSWRVKWSAKTGHPFKLDYSSPHKEYGMWSRDSDDDDAGLEAGQADARRATAARTHTERSLRPANVISLVKGFGSAFCSFMVNQRSGGRFEQQAY